MAVIIRHTLCQKFQDVTFGEPNEYEASLRNRRKGRKGRKAEGRNPIYKHPDTILDILPTFSLLLLLAIGRLLLLSPFNQGIH